VGGCISAVAVAAATVGSTTAGGVSPPPIKSQADPKTTITPNQKMNRHRKK
jgi:hypothetical protein